MKQLTLEEAEDLALRTDYAVFAVGEEINTADAGAFFLEGYERAQKDMVPFLFKFAEWWKSNVTKAEVNGMYVTKNIITACFTKEQLLETFLKTKQ